MDDSEVINFLLQTEIIPLALRIMDNGSELSKTVATFIIQKILLDEMGLRCDATAGGTRCLARLCVCDATMWLLWLQDQSIQLLTSCCCPGLR